MSASAACACRAGRSSSVAPSHLHQRFSLFVLCVRHPEHPIRPTGPFRVNAVLDLTVTGGIGPNTILPRVPVPVTISVFPQLRNDRAAVGCREPIYERMRPGVKSALPNSQSARRRLHVDTSNATETPVEGRRASAAPLRSPTKEPPSSPEHDCPNACHPKGIARSAHLPKRPNGQRISGARRAEGDERVRCMRVLGGVRVDLKGPLELTTPSRTPRYEHPRRGSRTWMLRPP